MKGGDRNTYLLKDLWLKIQNTVFISIYLLDFYLSSSLPHL